MEIANRVAVVTGGAIGIGRPIALALAEAGAEVVVADLDSTEGGETVRRASAGSTRFMRVDMASSAEVVDLIRLARPAILVNNAGGGGHIPPHFPAARPDQWEATIRLNLLAAMRATQLALEPMRRQGEGAVVNIASTAGLGLAPYQSPEYGAAKAGLVRFTSTLGNLRPVRVNCLAPDWVATERLTEADRRTKPPPIPLDVVAAATLDLVRDDALAGRVMVLDREAAPRLLDPQPQSH
jgi:NAD(P)-dependent dehydrogenase (short-subunit alcohol dehydrogenase family)